MLDYWRMKLGGTYVVVNGKYTQIDGITLDDKKLNADKVKIRSPDDEIPYLLFTTTAGKTLTFEDFEIKFPRDQYVLTKKGSAVFGERRMSRSYKLAPTNDCYHLGRPSKCSLGEYLNATEARERKTGDLTDFKKKQEFVFSSDIAVVQPATYIRHIEWKGRPIVELTRGPDYLDVAPLVPDKYIPTAVSDLFPEYTKKGRQEAQMIKDFKNPQAYIFSGPGRNTYYNWKEFPTYHEINGIKTRSFAWRRQPNGNIRSVIVNRGDGQIYEVRGANDLEFTGFAPTYAQDVMKMLEVVLG